MSQLPSVAVVILNWNGRSFLQKFLPSVLVSDYQNLSVVVADNASSDDSVLFLQENFPEVTVLAKPVNEGFAKGYNSALKQLDADYFVVLNSDVEVDKGWISPAIYLMENDTKIAACQPKILSYKNKSQFEYAGACGGWIDFLGYPFSRGRVFDHCETDHGQYDQSIEIFWATGAAMFVRASVFRAVGGFDDYFFAHQEEIDLCWRMQRAGYRIFVAPASVVYHVGGGTLSADNPKKIFLNFRNNLVMLSKNLPHKESAWKIPYRILLNIVAAFQALAQGKFKTFIAISKAHVAYFKWILNHKTALPFPKIKMKDLNGVCARSIVWQFFIKKKKTYSEIVGSKK